MLFNLSLILIQSYPTALFLATDITTYSMFKHLTKALWTKWQNPSSINNYTEQAYPLMSKHRPAENMNKFYIILWLIVNESVKSLELKFRRAT